MEMRVLKKVFVIGPAKVGKTRLLYGIVDNRFTEDHKSTIAVDFLVKTIGTTRLQLWDSSPNITSELASAFLKRSDAFIVVIDPTSLDLINIQSYKPFFDEIEKNRLAYSEKPKIFFVVSKMDLINAKSNNISNLHNCQTLVGEIKNQYQSLDYHEEIIYYSAKDSILSSVEFERHIEKEIFEKNPLLKAIYRWANGNEVENADEEKVNNDDISTQPPIITWTGLFKLLLLFAVLSLVFMAAGGLTGGLEHVWDNIEAFFEAIKMMTDWGVGVVAASIGSAFVLTGVVAALCGYYNTKLSHDNNNNNQDEGKILGDHRKEQQTEKSHASKSAYSHLLQQTNVTHESSQDTETKEKKAEEGIFDQLRKIF